MNYQLADWTRGLQRSMMRQLVNVVNQPGMLSLAGGLPDPALFPADAYRAALNSELAADRRALQYGPPSQRLAQHITQIMALRGVAVSPEQVFITTGSQQGLSILARLLMNPGDPVMLERFTFTGAWQVLAPYAPAVHAIAIHLDSGPDVNAMTDILKSGIRPKLFYTVPDGHNPLGLSISREKRAALAELARAHHLPIIEDDPYGLLYYDDNPLPPLRALEPDWVFYAGSFSKILAPGLRLGWLIVPPALMDKTTVIKESLDLESAQLTQRAVSAYLDSEALPAHLELVRRTYRARRDALLQALAQHMPPGTQWTKPSAGMFSWVQLPGNIDTMALLEHALTEAKVAFVPGAAFAVVPDAPRNTLRLSFATVAPDAIQEAVSRLGRLLAARL